MYKIIASPVKGSFSTYSYMYPNEFEPSWFQLVLAGKTGAMLSVGTFRSLFSFLMSDCDRLVMRDINPNIVKFNQAHLEFLKCLRDDKTLSTQEQMDLYLKLLENVWETDPAKPIFGRCFDNSITLTVKEQLFLNSRLVTNPLLKLKSLTKEFHLEYVINRYCDPVAIDNNLKQLCFHAFINNGDSFLYMENVTIWGKLMAKLDKISVEEGSITDIDGNFGISVVDLSNVPDYLSQEDKQCLFTFLTDKHITTVFTKAKHFRKPLEQSRILEDEGDSEDGFVYCTLSGSEEKILSQHKEIIDLSQGNIIIQSNPGMISIYNIKLP